MKFGDSVIIYREGETHYSIKLRQGENLATHAGDISHDEIMKHKMGETVATHLGKQFYILPLTHFDRMMKVKRKTTIVYPKDAGWFLLRTDVKPGSQVIEVGTGSGALSVLLASVVGKEGKVYSYERRKDLLDNAVNNIKRYDFSDRVIFHEQDVQREGFVEKDVDAVFIDVPMPWELIEAARLALKPGYNLVSISPHVEQVKETVKELKVQKFVRVEVVEIIHRELLIREVGTRPKERAIVHTGYLVTAQKTV